MNPISALLAALGALSIAFAGLWAWAVAQARRTSSGNPDANPATDARFPTPLQIGVGFGTNFFDALGIGSFATTTALFRALRMVPDRIIPGTLNAGHTMPTVVQAFIFTKLIPVDVLTLITMIGAAVLGAWLGAGVVARWPKRKVQIGMGVSLLAAAVFMFMRQMNLFPPGSEEIGVRGAKLAIAIGGNFLLGALMTLGIGLYAPCMILVGLLGMSERTAFPIMMGSCAFLMPVGSLRFIREQSYSLRNALGLAIGGVFGSYVAAKFFESLDIRTVRWLVIAVVVYTAVTMLLAARSEQRVRKRRDDDVSPRGGAARLAGRPRAPPLPAVPLDVATERRHRAAAGTERGVAARRVGERHRRHGDSHRRRRRDLGPFDDSRRRQARFPRHRRGGRAHRLRAQHRRRRCLQDLQDHRRRTDLDAAVQEYRQAGVLRRDGLPRRAPWLRVQRQRRRPPGDHQDRRRRRTLEPDRRGAAAGAGERRGVRGQRHEHRDLRRPHLDCDQQVASHPVLDNGRTWSAVSTPVPAGPSAGLFSIAFASRDRGIVVGGDYKAESAAVDNAAVTTDGGVTWTG